MTATVERALTVRQRLDLVMVSHGYVSSIVAKRIKPLVRRGLVKDLGLYDYDAHCKRYGSDRYKITTSGKALLK